MSKTGTIKIDGVTRPKKVVFLEDMVPHWIHDGSGSSKTGVTFTGSDGESYYFTINNLFGILNRGHMKNITLRETKHGKNVSWEVFEEGLVTDKWQARKG